MLLRASWGSFGYCVLGFSLLHFSLSFCYSLALIKLPEVFLSPVSSDPLLFCLVLHRRHYFIFFIFFYFFPPPPPVFN
ncbi:hypothetical protein BDZ91DRAFT_731834 [Kalaharituber pfeilii]|nr:hypothetical protein BDZ91DRAFT_731834 [Kalaharituber pfeilii]